MKYPFQQLSVSNAPYAALLKEAAAAVIDSGRYLRGPYTEAFEQQLSAYLGTRHSIATGNGLDALKLIMRGYIELGRLHPGDEILAASNSFIATILPATELGLKVRLLDPDPTTFGLDLSRIAPLVSDKTRLIAVTHLYGTPSWDEESAAALRESGIILVEDNAQAIGARWHGRRTGTLGDASAISFYPAKNLGALGDAGAVSTDDEDLAEVIDALHNYGSDRTYHYKYQGYNTRIDEIQAAFLSIKLRDTDRVNAARRLAAERYCRDIDNPEVATPAIIPDTEQVWHQYVVRCRHRDALADYLRQNGVGTLIHYPYPIHRQPCCEGMAAGPLPVSEALAEEVLSLPIADITPDDASEIATIINRFHS